MPDVGIQSVVFYFNRKGREWASRENSIEDYIRKSGIDGLREEFESDPSFVNVCDFIKRASTIQLRSGMAKGLEEYARQVFGIPLIGEMDIIIGAIEGACGKKVEGEPILKGVKGTLVGAVILGILSAITS
ncbi:MAG: hypothetical protein QXU18_07565 [Thermoplasmatales archaeon]